MPVRVAIQSSWVSTMDSRSLLVITEEGTLLPLPLSLQPVSHCRTASTSTAARDLRLLCCLVWTAGGGLAVGGDEQLAWLLVCWRCSSSGRRARASAAAMPQRPWGHRAD